MPETWSTFTSTPCVGLSRSLSVFSLTVHVRVAGVGSVFPVKSVARTSNVCAPSARFE